MWNGNISYVLERELCNYFKYVIKALHFWLAWIKIVQPWMFVDCLHEVCQMKVTLKKKNPMPIKERLGLGGACYGVVTPISDVRKIHIMRSLNVWTWNRNQMPVIVQVVWPPQVLSLIVQGPCILRYTGMVVSYCIECWLAIIVGKSIENGFMEVLGIMQ